MRETQAVLCLDTESLMNPAIIGLGGENLESQSWLRVFYGATEARDYLQTSSEGIEIWVASSDDVDPINLAAAFKKDSKTNKVCLLAFQGSGSLKSRANAAGIDKTLSLQEFLGRYAHFKQISRTQSLSSDDSNKAIQELRRPHIEAGVKTSLCSKAIPEAKIAQAKSAHVLTIVSASGGAGKSTVAALAALGAQRLGFNTLLLDADMQFGDMHYIFAEENPLTIDKVVADHQLISQLKSKDSQPALLAAPQKLEQAEQLSFELPKVVDLLKSYFDVIVVNTGAFWAEQHISLLERSTTGLFLVSQQASSIRACKHALDLCMRCGIATRPFLFALNRCERNAPFTSIDVSCALQGAHVVELQEGGHEVSDLLSAGLPFDLVGTRNDFCQSIETMLLSILPETENTAARTQLKAERKRFRLGFRRRRAACL